MQLENYTQTAFRAQEAAKIILLELRIQLTNVKKRSEKEEIDLLLEKSNKRETIRTWKNIYRDLQLVSRCKLDL
jgi:hypothetical protein